MIVLVIVGLVVVGWKLRKRLPTADWSFGLYMSRTDAIVRRQDSLATSTHAAVLEKVTLIALVGAFAKVLEVESTGLQIVGATMLAVLANAGLSIWLARRAIEWASLVLEFVVLGTVNTLLLSAYASLVGDGGLDRSPVAPVLREPLQHGHHLTTRAHRCEVVVSASLTSATHLPRAGLYASDGVEVEVRVRLACRK